MEFDGARVAVTGGTGFLGSALIVRLLKEGARVRATRFRGEPKVADGEVEFVTADLRLGDDCARVVEGMDYVFHCAADTAGAAVMVATPLAHVTPNVVMNTRLLDKAHGAGVRKFLFISSGAAYPDTRARPVREPEMFDADPLDVYFAVGWMKRYSEILCRTYAEKIKNPMPAVVVRPSNVYGPLDKFDPETSHVTAALVRRVVTRENPMVIWGTGEDVRDLIYIDDFIDGVIAAFRHDSPYLAVNIASGEAYSVKDILRTAMEVDGYTDADIRYDPSKPSTAPIRLIDNALAKALLGFEAKIPLAEGLRRTMAWYRENYV